MKDKIQQKLNSARNTLKTHQTGITIGAVAVATASTALLIRNAKVLNGFLEEHGLTDEYYKMTDDEN